MAESADTKRSRTARRESVLIRTFPWDSMVASARAYFRASLNERHVILEHGVPATYLNTLSREIPIPKSRLCRLVGISLSTVNRKIRSGSRLRLFESDRVMFLAQLIGQIDCIACASADRCKVDPGSLIMDWLAEPHAALNGHPPSDYFDTGIGRRLISDLLQKLDSHDRGQVGQESMGT